MKAIKLISAHFILILGIPIHSQPVINNIYPAINQLNIPLDTEIQITLNYPIGNYTFDVNRLFSVHGVNSGVITGNTCIDEINNQINFKPNHRFFPGEIIYVGFGPLIDYNGNTIKAFHWQFTTEVPHKTEAQFDSLKQINILTNGGYLIDVNKDGKLDILTRDAILYYNLGNYEFNSTKILMNDSTELNNIGFISDFNRDGIYDIVSKDVTASKTSKILFGINDSTFMLTKVINPIDPDYSGNVFCVGDVNDDNYDDIIFGEYDMTDTTLILRLYLNDKKGNLQYSHDILNIKSSVYGTALSDINKDGRLDLIFHVNNYNSKFVSILIYANVGDGQFQLIKEINSGSHSPRPGIFTQDYNGDGWLDISIEKDQGRTYYYNIDSLYSSYLYSFWGPPEVPDEANQGDFNGDSLFDLFISHIQIAPEEGNLSPINQSVWISDGKFFRSVSNTLIAYKKDYTFCCKPLIGDIDQDGDVDAINCGYPTYIALNSNNPVDVKKEVIDNHFLLYNNYPNPFNPTTTINYTLPEDGKVQIKVFDILGREVATLMNGFDSKGKHYVTWDGSNTASGIYFCTITFKNQTISKKMLMMK